MQDWRFRLTGRARWVESVPWRAELAVRRLRSMLAFILWRFHRTLPVSEKLILAGLSARTQQLAAYAGIWAMLLVAGLTVYPTLASPWIWPGYAYMHERFTGTEVFDVQGRYLGMIPGGMDPLGDWGTTYPTEDHKSAYIDEPPEGFWRVLTALEDRHLGTWRSRGGIDVLAFARSAVWDLPRGQMRGASTLPMMLVRSMHHRNADPRDPFAKKLARKFTELRDAPILMRNLRGEDMTELKRWAAMHVPLVQGAPASQLGSSLYGVGAAARVLFGVGPGELSLAEEAILAAAFYRPVLLAPPNNPRAEAARDRRWERLQRRALKGLRVAYGDDDPEANRAMSHLASMPAPMPQIATSLLPLLPESPQEQFRIGGNPTRRAVHLARPEIVQAIGELQDLYGNRWRRRVVRVRLTVDAPVNGRFKTATKAALARFEERHREQLDLSLTGAGGAPRAQAVVALAGPDDRLELYYSNSQDTFYGGPQNKRGSDAAYDPRREDRQIASLGKVAVALVLAGEGDAATQTYCNRALAGIHNPGRATGYQRCDTPGARVRARDVYARSLNLPLIWRLQRVETPVLEQVLEDFGITRVSDASLAVSLPLGMEAAGPRTLHRMMAIVTKGVAGVDPGSRLPTILAQVDTMAVSRSEPPPRSEPRHDVTRYFAESGARHYLNQTLGSVVEPGGTLGALADWAPDARRVRIHLAKTGTSTLAGGAVRDLYAAGGLELDGRIVSYFSMVGASDPRRPLGHGLAGGHLAPLVREALGHCHPQPALIGDAYEYGYAKTP